MFRMKSFFCGIVITSVVWVMIIYLYILKNQINSKSYHLNQTKDSFVSRLPVRHKLKSRLNSDNNHLNQLKLLRKVENRRRIESNLINDDPIEDEFQRKQDINWYNSAIRLSANASGNTDLISLGIINTKEDKKVKDEGFKKHAFNVLISNRIGFRRQLPDTRNGLCKTRQPFVPVSELPTASVIICFYNEAFTTLLRTVYSVIDRTNDKLLKEILLVDDFSDDGSYQLSQWLSLHLFVWIKGEIKGKLMEFVYTKLPPKVKLIRTPERAGLIRARMFGAHHSTGQVLVFLDSHCEVNVDWLTPLLTRIHENRSTVVCPIIDIISANTFEYTSSPIVRGGFNWFVWLSIDLNTNQINLNSIIGDFTLNGIPFLTIVW